MNRNHLALFHAVAQAGSITGAAIKLNVSQPAVSKQVSELEAELGVRLLDRLPRGCQLTGAGQLLAEHADRWLTTENEAVRAIEEYRGMKRGLLALGASQTIGAYLMPKILAKFRRDNPGIELRLKIGNTQEIQHSLLERTIDLGLTEGQGESELLQSRVFCKDELVLIAATKHPFLRQKKVKARDLCREAVIFREEGSGTRAVVEHALRLKGLKIEPYLSLASPEAIKNAVEVGLGVAFMSRLVIEKELRLGSLGIIPLLDLKIHRPLLLQSLKNRSRSPAQTKFLEILESSL